MKKIKIISLSIIMFLVSITIILLNYDDNHNIIENKVLYKLNNNADMISMMLETDYDSGMYEVSSDIDWPDTSKYIFNSELSSCENGGILSWNYSTNTLELTNNISDKCYVYFDMNADVTVYIEGAFSTTAQASIECSNGNASYSNQYKTISVGTIDYTKCSLTYESPSTVTYLNDYIISLSGTTQGDGQVVNENGYRYEGKDPNNYVWFNNELWRIIGVFDSNSHGVSNTNLVKIIKAEPLSNRISWNTSNNNDWSTSHLYNILNDAYLNSTDGTDSGHCYAYSNTISGQCDFTSTGISSEYRSMIQKVTWYLGGNSTNAATADTFYSAERGTSTYNSTSTSVTNYIGLMYPSDYGYATLASSCARTTNLSAYNNSSCSGENWIIGKSIEWTITQNNNSSVSTFVVYGFSGYLSYYNVNNGYLTSYIGVNNGYVARPVLYLSSSVYLVGGEGTASSPYIIGM